MTPRTPSPIDRIADAHLVEESRLNPLSATEMGVSGYDDQMTDLSPDGHQARADAARATLVALDGAPAQDDVDEATAAAMRFSLGLEIELFEAGEFEGALNNIASPVQGLREVFDLMPTSTTQDWENIAKRLLALPGAVEGYTQSLGRAADRGLIAARRQVAEAIRQADALAQNGSFFDELVEGLSNEPGHDSLKAELGAGARAAKDAYRNLTSYLSNDLASRAGDTDAVGRERYALWSSFFVGARLDLDETYAWGLEELALPLEQLPGEWTGAGRFVTEATSVVLIALDLTY